MDGIVISLQLQPGRWLNAEVHPHEWHFRQKLDWMLKVSAAFVFVGAVALFFIRRIGRPLNQLTAAARSFADGMEATEVAEDGPIDLRRAIRSFNAMQRQVAGEMARRTGTLAAISHDVRTPLTALRVKAEMVDDPAVRDEPDRQYRENGANHGLGAGVSARRIARRADAARRSERAAGERVRRVRRAGARRRSFVGEHGCPAHVPTGSARARGPQPDRQRDQVWRERACRLRSAPGFVDIVVADDGPGIPEDELRRATEPFERLSTRRARSSRAVSASASPSCGPSPKGTKVSSRSRRMSRTGCSRRFGYLPAGPRDSRSERSAVCALNGRPSTAPIDCCSGTS